MEKLEPREGYTIFNLESLKVGLESQEEVPESEIFKALGHGLGDICYVLPNNVVVKNSGLKVIQALGLTEWYFQPSLGLGQCAVFIMVCGKPQDEDLRIWSRDYFQRNIKETTARRESIKVAKTCGELQYPIETYTCFGCSIVKDCKYSFDPYNTSGDCLAEK